jgi:hypothetical protein
MPHAASNRSLIVSTLCQYRFSLAVSQGDQARIAPRHNDTIVRAQCSGAGRRSAALGSAWSARVL